jgi:exonuclease SbcD
MKILHTSDWHLGRGLGDYELYEDQEAAIKFIVDEAISQKVNVFVVAGDVFDRGTPPPKSIKLLNQALTRLNEAGVVSIVTAGNHDNAERLSAYSNLLTENVHIWGSITDTGKPILVNDEHGLVAFYPITYLYPDKSIETFEELGQGKVERSHQAVHEHAMNLIRANFEELKKSCKSPRMVVISHSFVTTYGTKSKLEIVEGLEVENGAVVSESERDISVGGVQTITADTFDGATYVALGHLHGAQKVSGLKTKATLAYSGSPIKYSLSEANHKKSFTIVNVGKESIISDNHLERVEIPQTRGMARLEGTCAELIDGRYKKHIEDFLELTITDEQLDTIELAVVRNYFKSILSTKYKNFNRTRLEEYAASDTNKMTDYEILATFFDKVSGTKLVGDDLATITSVFEESLLESGGK